MDETASASGKETTFEKAFHGLCRDYMNGVIDSDAMETAMDTLFQPDVAVSLGMNGCDDGVVESDWDAPVVDLPGDSIPPVQGNGDGFPCSEDDIRHAERLAKKLLGSV